MDDAGMSGMTPSQSLTLMDDAEAPKVPITGAL